MKRGAGETAPEQARGEESDSEDIEKERFTKRGRVTKGKQKKDENEEKDEEESRAGKQAGMSAGKGKGNVGSSKTRRKQQAPLEVTEVDTQPQKKKQRLGGGGTTHVSQKTSRRADEDAYQGAPTPTRK